VRLFVDVDDTLVLYNQKGVNPYGAICGTPYIVNEPLVAFIHWWAKEHPDALVVIWSGGGRAYAQNVAARAGCSDVGAAYLCKDRDTLALVDKDDIVFDDQPIKVAARVWGPYDVAGQQGG